MTIQTRTGVVAPNPAVVHASLDDEMVLLNVETGIYFGLDEVGTLIWSMISDGVEQTAIVDRIVSEYGVDQTVVQADVQSFIGTLDEKGLLQADA